MSGDYKIMDYSYCYLGVVCLWFVEITEEAHPHAHSCIVILLDFDYINTEVCLQKPLGNMVNILWVLITKIFESVVGSCTFRLTWEMLLGLVLPLTVNVSSVVFCYVNWLTETLKVDR